MRVTDEAIMAVNIAIDAAKALPRSRETNIAITHLETALLWVEKADRECPDYQEYQRPPSRGRSR